LSRLRDHARPLRRLLAHAGLAFALVLAQLGMLDHAYTAHPLRAAQADEGTVTGAAAPAAEKSKGEPGSDARDLCSLCLAFSVLGGSLPATYHFDAPVLPVAEYFEPHAHGAPHFPFLSYASRAPPSPRA